MRTQRFCNSVCSQEFFTAERRAAVQALRAETSTYHGREAEVEGPSGRWAAEANRLTTETLPGPDWSFDPSGPEPAIDGTGEGTALGYRIAGDAEPHNGHSVR